jgi:DNA-binding response OmpR family regulator
VLKPFTLVLELSSSADEQDGTFQDSIRRILVEGKILIVEDTQSFRQSLLEYFEREGFEVFAAEDGSQALARVNQTNPDLIILDVQLPFLDGFEVCKLVRKQSGNNIGIIMISGSKKDVVDRVVGLELGADVYMTKPFETRELLAQVRSLLRRVKARNEFGDSHGWFIVDDYLQIDLDRRVVRVGGEELRLTQLEFDLLKYMVDRPGVPCGRSDLIDLVWGYEAGGDINDSAVNTAISKLRRKIEPDPTIPR